MSSLEINVTGKLASQCERVFDHVCLSVGAVWSKVWVQKSLSGVMMRRRYSQVKKNVKRFRSNVRVKAVRNDYVGVVSIHF